MNETIVVNGNSQKSPRKKWNTKRSIILRISFNILNYKITIIKSEITANYEMRHMEPLHHCTKKEDKDNASN